MDPDYNFWRDLFDTYQSLPPWLQLAWLIVLAALALAAGRGLGRIVALALHAVTVKPHSPPSPPPAGKYRVANDERGVLYLEHVAGEASELDERG